MRREEKPEKNYGHSALQPNEEEETNGAGGEERAEERGDEGETKSWKQKEVSVGSDREGGSGEGQVGEEEKEDEEEKGSLSAAMAVKEQEEGKSVEKGAEKHAFTIIVNTNNDDATTPHHYSYAHSNPILHLTNLLPASEATHCSSSTLLLTPKYSPIAPATVDEEEREPSDSPSLFEQLLPLSKSNGNDARGEIEAKKWKLSGDRKATDHMADIGSPLGVAQCHACHSGIYDRFILRVYPDIEFHANCLRCSECCQPLADESSAFVRNEKIYCRADYSRLFARRCARCGEPLQRTDMVLRQRDAIYHLDCFQCSTCRRVLAPGELFVHHGQELFCRPDCFYIAAAAGQLGTSNGQRSLTHQQQPQPQHHLQGQLAAAPNSSSVIAPQMHFPPSALLLNGGGGAAWGGNGNISSSSSSNSPHAQRHLIGGGGFQQSTARGASGGGGHLIHNAHLPPLVAATFAGPLGPNGSDNTGGGGGIAIGGAEFVAAGMDHQAKNIQVLQVLGEPANSQQQLPTPGCIHFTSSSSSLHPNMRSSLSTTSSTNSPPTSSYSNPGSVPPPASVSTTTNSSMGLGSGGGGRAGISRGGSLGGLHGGRVNKKKDKPTQRIRTVLNDNQLKILKQMYNSNQRPDTVTKEQLVELTGLPPRVIRVWFQNKRCKDKKRQNAQKESQQQHEKEQALHGVRLNGVGPLVATSPSSMLPPGGGMLDANNNNHNGDGSGEDNNPAAAQGAMGGLMLTPIEIHQFPQNPALWGGAAVGGGNDPATTTTTMVGFIASGGDMGVLSPSSQQQQQQHSAAAAAIHRQAMAMPQMPSPSQISMMHAMFGGNGGSLDIPPQHPHHHHHLHQSSNSLDMLYHPVAGTTAAGVMPPMNGGGGMVHTSSASGSSASAIITNPGNNGCNTNTNTASLVSAVKFEHGQHIGGSGDGSGDLPNTADNNADSKGSGGAASSSIQPLPASIPFAASASQQH